MKRSIKKEPTIDELIDNFRVIAKELLETPFNEEDRDGSRFSVNKIYSLLLKIKYKEENYLINTKDIFCNDCYYFLKKSHEVSISESKFNPRETVHHNKVYEFCTVNPDRKYNGKYLCDKPSEKNKNIDCKDFKFLTKDVKFLWIKKTIILKINISKYDCDYKDSVNNKGHDYEYDSYY